MSVYVIAIIVGFVYASLLYVANKKQHYGKILTTTLFVTRTAVVAIVVLLFFNPYLKHKKNKIEPATIVVAQDNSKSLILTKDSTFYKEKYPLIIDSVFNTLEENFIIDKYLFGDKTRTFDSIDYQDYYTDINEILNHIRKTYYKKNVGAVVLLSDGICNKSYPPEQNINSYPFPIYSVTLGDTTNYPDIFIKDIRYNKVCRANTSFPIQLIANANNSKGKSMEIELYRDNEIIDNIVVPINSNRFSKILDFNINSEDEGVRQIDIKIKSIDKETQTKNNDRRFFVEVVDQQYKILYLAKSPHPDIASMKNILGEHYDFDIIYFNDEIPEINDYDILILHQVPFLGMNNYPSLDEQLKLHKDIPILYIIGENTDIENLNKLQSSAQIRRGAVSSLLDVKPHYNQSFGLFNIDKEVSEEINNFPPLSLPHLEIRFNSNHDIMMFMNLMDVKTETPLLSFTNDDKRKSAFLLGTGIWRWKLYNYYHEGKFDSFDELISKTIQYLLTEKDKELNIYHKESYLNNETITFNAEIKNPSQEIFNDADLKINIKNKHNTDTYEYEFLKEGKSYILNIKALPEGIYTYTAEAEYGGKRYDAKGTFAIVDVGAEAQDLVADARRMESLSSLTDGKNFNVDEINMLVEALNNDERICSVMREENNYIDLINWKTLFFIILIMISIEWLLRKIFS